MFISDVRDYQLLVAIMRDLLEKASSKQRLGKTFRSRLVEELERLIVNKQRLRLYTCAFDNPSGMREAARFAIDGDTCTSILNNGLASLSDRDLLRLGVDCLAMCGLHVCITLYGDFYSYWRPLLRSTPRLFRDHD